MPVASGRIRRWLLISLSTGALVLGLELLLVSAGTELARRLTSITTALWLTSIVSLMLGLCFSPLLRLIRSSIERRFFPGRLALRRQLTELAAELSGEDKEPAMADSLVQRLAGILGLQSATLLLADPKTRVLTFSASTLESGVASDEQEKFLLPPDEPGVEALVTCDRPLAADELITHSEALADRLKIFEAQLAVPLVNRDRLVGLLLLGQKLSGQRYRVEEVDLMGLFAHHVASALENARLFESVTLESLTGLLRREAILEALDKELLRAQRYGRPLSVAMIDLDHFKQVNDRFGHLAGDALLKRIASALAKNVRSADLLGRYGGEEFLLVMPETDLVGAIGVAEKLRALVAVTPLPVESENGSRRVEVTLTVGVASLDCVQEGAVGRDLLECADRRLYRAKRQGRNRVEPGRLAIVRS